MNVSNRYARIKKKETTYFPVYSLIAVLGMMLLFRDGFSIQISKYIFLFIICSAILLLDLNSAVCLFCFILPLYVGLPGNYITLIIILKFLLNYKNFKMKISSLFLTLAIMAFVCVQNLILDYVSVYNMICILEIFLVLCLLSYESCIDKKQMLFMYVLGVATLGIVMLFTTLQTYQFHDILTSTARLGTTAVTKNSKAMNVSVDPNYYGLFCITAISIAFPLLTDLKRDFSKKYILLSATILCFLISLIGLSRSFVIVFFLWIGLVLIFQKGFKRFLITFALLFAAIIAIKVFCPQIIDGILFRFESNDMIGANGREQLINEYFGKWSENIISMLFGVGMFVCTVHSMQLQYLFGGGLILSSLMVIFALSQIKSVMNKYSSQLFYSYIPMIVVFVMAATVPIATSITFMFPTVIALFSFNYMNEVRYEKNEKINR